MSTIGPNTKSRGGKTKMPGSNQGDNRISGETSSFIKMADQGRDMTNNVECEFYKSKDWCIYGTSCRKLHNMSLSHNTNSDVIRAIDSLHPHIHSTQIKVCYEIGLLNRKVEELSMSSRRPTFANRPMS